MNALQFETSPYLIQHANNPVEWYSWNDKALNKAKYENKILLISIGYSACHWCHVMENQCFENEHLAKLMNEHFICIKVDREERPDIDNIYMMAVQLMTGRGGWPLNCFALPDGRPIYGGTYFTPQQWENILKSIAESWKNNKEKTIEYAQKLQQGIVTSDLHFAGELEKTNDELLKKALHNWQNRFDTIYGGPNKAPKFPLPINYQFLLRYSFLKKESKINEHVELTLTKMAMGGIYDQLAGGFARYSVDAYWKVPHFEKMLYDNAQLLALFSEAYKATKNEYYKQIALEINEFSCLNWQTTDGLFYSAFDADTEGIEGKYYVWTKNELENIFIEKFNPIEFNEFCDLFSINDYGFWEHENFVLQHQVRPYKLKINDVDEKIKKWKKVLLEHRSKRTSPLLDDKQLTSWNAMMSKALAISSSIFQNNEMLLNAEKCFDAITNILTKESGKLWRTYKNGKAHIDGFLEDYAFCIEAAIALYSTTFKTKYLLQAEAWLTICMNDFKQANSPLFYYTDAHSEPLVARLTDIQDNVIPSSNSSLANSLFLLGHYLSNENYILHAKEMLKYVTSHLEDYPEGYANWCNLLLKIDEPFHDIVITGTNAYAVAKELGNIYIPNSIIMATDKINSGLDIFTNRFDEHKTQLFVCTNNTCSLPYSNVSEMLESIEK